jgi:putative photosynthetic complex assembly protein
MKPHQASVAVAPDTFPRWVLQAMGALLLFALLSVAVVRITGNGPDQLRAVVVTERALRFEDRVDGGIAVIDGASGKLLTAVHGEQGFLRGVVRALARERRTRDMGPEQPFLLTARADGSLTLSDPETRQSVELESFGPTNAGVFARFLALQPDSISN